MEERVRLKARRDGREISESRTGKMRRKRKQLL